MWKEGERVIMRNYKNETKWAKGKYERIEIKINKKLGEEFKKQLKNKRFTITEFFRKEIEKFLNNT